ncbi:MAG: FHA domain-containing protein [Chloroflexota bacterium]|nr:FHA domain-containing protein [Chloroflexota bacterium]
MSNNLDRIEANLRALFEEKLFKFFTGGQPATGLIKNLIHVIHANPQKYTDGSLFAPDQITFHVPEEDLIEWQDHQDILDKLASSLHKICLIEGFSFHKPPSIDVQAKPNIVKHQFEISSHFSDEHLPMPDTAAMEQSKQSQGNVNLPQNACFVIGGVTNFPLNKSVVDIGRHSDCDLILDDLHVSRHHAQLRAINNQFVIFDTGSSAGVFLNGKKVSQASLQSGDVVRIGLVNLIYIQDTTSANPTTALPIDLDNNLDNQHIVGGDHE